MLNQQPKGPICQSCGMPLEKGEDFGTGVNGFRINDYCHFCFQNGPFTEPDISMRKMIDKWIGIMARRGIVTENPARALMTKSFQS